MELNNISSTSSRNQILKKSTSSMQKRRKVNIGTGQGQLEKELISVIKRNEVKTSMSDKISYLCEIYQYCTSVQRW